MSGARLILVAALAASLLACKREERESRDDTAPGQASPAQTQSENHLGEAKPKQASSHYDENAYAVAEGKRLFSWFNCSGCHSHGGGGMGPPLMDEKWIYGSDPANIFATIVEGRPNGMPSFGGRIPDQQVWQLVAYVRSLSGLVPKSASSTRSDHMSEKIPEQPADFQKPESSVTPPSATR